MSQHSETAERSLLAALLAGSDYSSELLHSVEARMFYAMRHQDLWRVAAKVSASGKRPDLIQVQDELARCGELERVGGEAYLMELADEHVSDAGLDGYAKLVRDYSIVRSAGVEAAKIAELARDGAEASDLVSAYLRVASDLSSEAEGRRRRPETAMGVIADILNNNEPARLWTGFDFIDLFTRISAENFIVIGARPGSGKSSLALGIAIEASRQGLRVLFNCLEMSTTEMTESMIAHETGIKLDRVINRRLGPHEMQQALVAIQAGSNIIFSPQKTMPELVAKCRSMKANGGIDLVITDFIQKMKNEKSENRTQEVGSISRAHKDLAIDFQIPVIALSQLSRAGDKEPTLKDLRESGDLEQDANAVYFLWRDSENPYERGFKIAKDRRGAGTDAIAIGFDGSIVRFERKTPSIQDMLKPQNGPQP